MAKSLERRLRENGISDAEARKVIQDEGLLHFCEQQGCGVEAGRRYAEKTLAIKDCALVSMRSLQTNRDVALELISAMFDWRQKILEENEKLRVENAELKRRDEVRIETAKGQLYQILESIKA
jgi:hypothetical protein